MGTSDKCHYFESEDWVKRIEKYALSAWDFETFLRKSPSRTFDTELFEQVADASSEYTAEEIAVSQMGDIIEIAPSDEIDISRTEVREGWLEANSESLPDSCPHQVASERDLLCRFHMSPAEKREADISPSEIADLIEDRITSDGNQAKQFVGARFRNLDLSARKLIADDNDPIDFRFITIQQEASFAETIFGHNVSFKGALFGEESNPTEKSEASFGDHYVEFEGDIDFMRASFEGKADFKFVSFGRKTRFNNARFARAAMFNYAQFRGKSDFMGVTFNGKADFSKAVFEDDASLNGQYNSAGIFNYTRFEGSVDIWNTTFNGKAEFWAAKFMSSVDGSYAQFLDEVRFNEATFTDIAKFQNAEFQREVIFKRVRTKNEWIDLTNTTIETGVIEQPQKAFSFFDLSQATIGEVSLGTGNGVSRDVFEYLRIWQTKFEEFDFADYTYALRPNWRIHTNKPEGAESPFEPIDHLDSRTLAALEQTYLRAKNGANAVGHNLAASRFFSREMSYRRQQHWRQIFRDSRWDRLKAFWRWLSNSLLGITSGYGEEPNRTIGFSLITIVAFSFLYWILPATPEYTGQFGQGYLLLSFQSFISFILGSPPIAATPGFQFITAVEGFIGAFLIALFVFTLTRSIHR